MGEIGPDRCHVPEEYGCANTSYVAYGLVAREIERGRSGYRSMELGAVPPLVMVIRSMPWRREPAQEIPAQARHRRMGRLLRV